MTIIIMLNYSWEFDLNYFFIIEIFKKILDMILLYI